MTVPARLRQRHAYHFTSIQNLESIIDRGLLCTNARIAQGIRHVDVADEGIQNRRRAMLIPGKDDRCIHDYVPFYFAKRTPMQLAVLNKKNVDQELLIYFCVSILLLENRPGAIFTDASANTDVPPKFYTASEAHQLESLNWGLIDDLRWSGYSNHERHQKMAELLVPNGVPLCEVAHLVTWDDCISNHVRALFAQKGVAPPTITEHPHHFFADPDDNWSSSLITGPVFLKHYFEETVERINIGSGATCTFPSIEAAVTAVRNNFSSIKELDDIDGLRPDYFPHYEDVGSHSRRVAQLIRESQEYDRLDPHNRAVLEMAAYLHDIGKGPKSRWQNSVMQRADNNHAKKSLPMLERILMQEIGALPRDSARRLVMLVTYDDLVGDIISRERDKHQLFDIVTCRTDIDMLVALSKADIGAINQQWLEEATPAIENLRKEAEANLEGVG